MFKHLIAAHANHRLGLFWSIGGLLASSFVAVVTMGIAPAQAALFADWATVSAGTSHTCGVRKNGKLYCWGYDYYGQVGDGDNPSPALAPRRIGSFEDWSAASAGGSHSCGIRTGKLYCWGWNFFGQVGNGSNDDSMVAKPEQIGSFEDWANVSAGGSHTCGVRTNGKLYCWGWDIYGQVGDGDSGSSALAPRRIGTFEDWANVSAGSNHTCGVRKNGKLYCWGFDNAGQVGDGNGVTTVGPIAPRRIGSFEDWVRVSGGAAHTCGVRKNGKLYCWGGDGSGELGNGSPMSPVDAPQRIGAFEDWANASAGIGHTCGVRSNGKLYCWGGDNDGQVGDGDFPFAAITPRRIGTFEDWTNASAGGLHSCGVRTNGFLYCWGDDEYGQVGDGNFISPHTSPGRV